MWCCQDRVVRCAPVHYELILVFHSMHGTMPCFESDRTIDPKSDNGRCRVCAGSLGRHTQPLPLTTALGQKTTGASHRTCFPCTTRLPYGDRYRTIVLTRCVYSICRISEGHPQHSMRFAVTRGRNSNTVPPCKHEHRIKTAHLSRFALLLVDVSERVRQAAQQVFRDHLQPRPDTVCR